MPLVLEYDRLLKVKLRWQITGHHHNITSENDDNFFSPAIYHRWIIIPRDQLVINQSQGNSQCKPHQPSAEVEHDTFNLLGLECVCVVCGVVVGGGGWWWCRLLVDMYLYMLYHKYNSWQRLLENTLELLMLELVRDRIQRDLQRWRATSVWQDENNRRKWWPGWETFKAKSTIFANLNIFNSPLISRGSSRWETYLRESNDSQGPPIPIPGHWTLLARTRAQVSSTYENES